MATGGDVRLHLRSIGVVAREEPTWLGLVVRFGAGTWQKVRVDLDDERVVLRADVCAEADLDGTDALRRNAELQAGALAVMNGIYVVRHVLALAHLAVADLDRVIAAIGREAARLRVRIAGRTAAPPDARYCEGYAD
jgi:hypothetical protein